MQEEVHPYFERVHHVAIVSRHLSYAYLDNLPLKGAYLWHGTVRHCLAVAVTSSKIYGCCCQVVSRWCLYLM